jgi:hypothetical protein
VLQRERHRRALPTISPVGPAQQPEPVLGSRRRRNLGSTKWLTLFGRNFGACERGMVDAFESTHRLTQRWIEHGLIGLHWGRCRPDRLVTRPRWTHSLDELLQEGERAIGAAIKGDEQLDGSVIA